MNINEKLPEIKGAARFWVYEGDIKYGHRSTLPEDGPWHVIDGSEIAVPRQPVLEDTGWVSNLIVTVGKQLLLDRLFGLGSAVAITSIGIGASATAAAVGDTQLATTPTIITQDATFPSRAALVVTNQGTFGTGIANVNWQECGIFNGNTNGTSVMLDHIAPIGPFNKTAAVSIILQVTITQS